MSGHLTVLQQFPVPRPTTNPYLVMLADHLRAVPGVSVQNFTWKGALLGRYDAFHIHWPEILVSGHTPLKQFLRQCLTVLLIVRLAVTRTPIVRTVHNVELPQDISRVEITLLRLIDRRTDFRITLNETTTLPEDQPSILIPHGHYREWFARHPRAAQQDGRFGYFGLIRRYKGVETLIEAFRSAVSTTRGLSLRVGGKPSTAELADTLTSLAGREDDVLLDLHFLGDDELVDIATSSELVVLPYRFMHNSGSTLAALSLDRPVLVPDNAVNRLLEAEVGPGWVHRFSGELDAEALLSAMEHVRATARGPVTFVDRDWDLGAARHVEAYRRAIAARRGASAPTAGAAR